MPDWLIRLLIFGMVGTTGMVVDFGITWLLREKVKINEYFANAIGFLLAVANNFFLNKYFTFDENTAVTVKQFLLYALVSLIGLGLNTLFLYMINKMLSSRFYWAKFLATGMVFIWNFTINSCITFY